MKNQPLIEQLLANLAASKVDPGVAVQALRSLCADESDQASASRLLQMLDAQEPCPFPRLKDQVRQQRFMQARRYHACRSSRLPVPEDCRLDLEDLPQDVTLGWTTHSDQVERFHAGLRLLYDDCFLCRHPDTAPDIAGVIRERLQVQAAALATSPSIWSLFPAGRAAAALETLIAAQSPGFAPMARSVHDAADREQARRVEVATASVAHGSGPVPPDADEPSLLAQLGERYSKAASLEEKRSLLHQVCGWPSDLAAPAILTMCRSDEWAHDQVGLILAMRFGQTAAPNAFAWRLWLERVAGIGLGDVDLAEEFPAESLRLWSLAHPDLLAPAQRQFLTDCCLQLAPDVAPEDFVTRWQARMAPAETERLLALQPSARPTPLPTTPPPLPAAAVTPAVAAAPLVASSPSAPPALPAPSGSSRSSESSTSSTVGGTLPPRPQPTVVRAPPPAPEPPAAPEPAPPPAPTAWETHVKPFVSENWYILVGLAMMLAGASLLAYYTWDKSWLVRYTIMPAMLAFFTAGLAETGGWLQRRDRELAGTAAMLRGAAIALLPLNFITLALLSGDAKVPAPALVVSAMGAVYLVFFGWGLWRWCGDVHPTLRLRLGGPLLLLNVVGLVWPLCLNLFHVSPDRCRTVMVAAFYTGFVVLSVAVVRFARRTLSEDLHKARLVAWFFGAALALTFIEVLAWAHIWARILPPMALYSTMVVLSGGLILLVERRILQFRGTAEYSSESFLGFALVLLGILLGIGHPPLRAANFALAGSIWLYQALPRRRVPDLWIGITLLFLGGAAIGLLRGFPGPWQPALLIGLSVLIGLVAALLRSERYRELRQAGFDFQLVALFLSTLVTVLARWHYNSSPHGAALCLAILAGLYLWRGWRDGRSRYALVGMLVLGLALPYLGCVDLRTFMPRGNTMVFGLAVLSLAWLLAVHLFPLPPCREVRSTVLFVYGITAVTAMTLRVVLERDLPADPDWYRQWMDYLGPLLMAGVLVLGAWLSRSLTMGAMAAGILVVLFPELRDNVKLSLPWLAFGSGLGSAVWALLLTLACFRLRDAQRLRDLGEGDRFLGTAKFPFCRYDHTLFTLPLLVSVFFLVGKIETWVLVRNFLHMGMRTVYAISLSGIVWLLLAVYFRQRQTAATVFAELGWLWVLAGLFFGNSVLCETAHWYWPVLVFGLLAQAFHAVTGRVLAPRWPWIRELFTQRMERVLRHGSLLVALFCMAELLRAPSTPGLLALEVFVASQLVWHCLKNQRVLHSAVLFALALGNVLALTAPSTGGHLLSQRLSTDASLTPVLIFLLAVQGLHLLLELAPAFHDRTRALWRPFMYGGTLLGLVLAGWCCADAFSVGHFAPPQRLLLTGLVLLTGRANGSPLCLLVVFTLGYLTLSLGLTAGPHTTVNLDLLLMPWRLSVLGLGLAVTAWLGERLHERLPRLTTGPFGIDGLRGRARDWLLPAATAAACFSVVLHTALDRYRADAAQLPASFVAAATLAFIGWLTSTLALLPASVVALTLGNLHALHHYAGHSLLARGLSELHLLALSVAASLAEVTLARLALSRHQNVVAALNRTCLALGALVLLLISVNYVGDPNLSDITRLRFVVSGAMALFAGWYFRTAARQPGPGEESLVALCEAVFLYGVSVFIWCLALQVPTFRRPELSLLAFWLPGVYFWLRAEFLSARNSAFAARSRDAATVIGFAILALYVFKAAFHLVFYPERPVLTDHYHYNSLYVMLLGLVLFRLHRLGGTEWLAFYGGLALVTGSYFAVTWFPQISPFQHAVPAAWTAILLVHFWIAASSRRSPLRTALLALGGLSGDAWLRLRQSWGLVLVVAVHIPVGSAMLDSRTDPHLLAPLLAGCASVVLHRGLVNRAVPYFAVAGVELLAALHAGFLVPSWLPAEQVVWVLLGLWALALGLHAQFRARITVPRLGTSLACWAGLVFLHILYHRPWSGPGLWAFAFLALLGSLTPRRDATPANAAEALFAGLFAAVPAWLAFFGTVDINTLTAPGLAPSDLNVSAILFALLAVYATAAAARLFQEFGVVPYRAIRRPAPRLFDQTLAWAALHGNALFWLSLWAGTFAAGAVQILHYGRACEPVNLAALCILYAALVPGWHCEGKARQSTAAYFLLQVCVALLFAAVRRQLMLTTSFWTEEYDVWTALAVSACLAATKQALDLQPGHVRRPFSLSLCALPLFALVWCVLHGLGTDMALVVVGLSSLIYTFLGKDDRESPYNVIAVGGFVAFVLLLFWSQFQVRVVFAYVVPAGIGVLALVQLFARRIPTEVRQTVRGAALLAMFASVAYPALVDDSRPVLFNLAFAGLGLAAMACGTLMRLRLFLGMGAAGVVADVVAIFAKAVWHLDRGAQMTAVGVLILLVGIGLVAGTVYYKTRRAAVNAATAAWFRRFGDWE
ncbi:MAG: hypothetical protein A3K19_15590 [Lentisphaerae bacterium RIFOXYB12_FULL_65_16]|nr:MAG: hypothetical protein A3K18_11605 [Lentisphaerae bacterium RIFOXYA12_64_32]OGV88524.1 MAG: hypothetical protein A3K19_15590 [Lentisphaerae bacterium RIFOXYB12_FULL_65_16]